MTDLSTLFNCVTALICFFGFIHYMKWKHKAYINDKIIELELENEVLSNENEDLSNENLVLSNENDRLKRETTFSVHSSKI